MKVALLHEDFYNPASENCGNWCEMTQHLVENAICLMVCVWRWAVKCAAEKRVSCTQDASKQSCTSTKKGRVTPTMQIANSH